MQIPEQDLITTLAGSSEAQTRVKGSRFLAVAESAPGREDAGKIVLREEKKYHGAAHHCWAWRALEAPDEQFACDDDGEPSGTAGIPILQAIEHAGLAGVAVVVTRYFGGVKLGTGGLARAYAEAATQAIACSETSRGMLAREFELTFDYPLTGRITHLIEKQPVVVTSRRFEQRVGLNIAVALSRADSLINLLTEVTAGKIGINPVGARPIFPKK